MQFYGKVSGKTGYFHGYSVFYLSEGIMIKNTLLILLLSLSRLTAVGEAGAIFLLIAPGAGPAGTGEAQVAKADDAYASYYNPAGLGFLKGSEAAGMHVNWLPNLASDLYYEFLTYRHHIDGLGSVGGHLIYLNLGEQIGMDEFGNPTDNWKSYMGAVAASFGTKLSESSSIGFNFKVFHQKLSDQVVAGEEGKGYSTDFGFDVGYLKKFKPSNQALRLKKTNKVNRSFDRLNEIIDEQKELNDLFLEAVEEDRNLYALIENQTVLAEDLIALKEQYSEFEAFEEYQSLEESLTNAVAGMDNVIELFTDIQNEEFDPATVENFGDSTFYLTENIISQLTLPEGMLSSITSHIETMEIDNSEDKFNLGISISNIGPKIDFVDVDQADPSPTNMRLGLFSQLYNDGYNKVNFLFDANKLLVTRYQMMDWDGDGLVGGYDEFGTKLDNLLDPSGIYNSEGKVEYNDKEYFDDPWYLAIVTAWLDDWYLGGDIDRDGDRVIGGWAWDAANDADGDGVPDVDELTEDPSGIYGKCVNEEVCKEKGTGAERKFTQELQEMIYNVGLEYWYTDSFALRAGYIHDYEGKIFNPTFGAGIRLLQYGFDFGYTAGEQGHPRANTMFFSINIEI